MRTAEEQLTESQALYERLEDITGLAAVFHQRSFILYRCGEFEKARLLCEQARTMQEQTDDQTGLLRTLRLLADIALEQEELDVANAYCQRALALCEALQHRGELGAIYYNSAVVRGCKEILSWLTRMLRKDCICSGWQGTDSSRR